MTFWVPEVNADNPLKFALDITQPCCVGPPETQFYMGGAGFATAIEAMEQATGKPLLWATIQFLTQTTLGLRVDVDVEITVPGRNVMQAMATISDQGRVLHRTVAALGGRDMPVVHQFSDMPDVPGPSASPLKDEDTGFDGSGNLIDQFERRLAFVDEDKGIECVWTRCKDHHHESAGMLAIMADFLLGAHSSTRKGTSLDNTLRFYQKPKSEWVLNVFQLDSFDRGAVHGSVHQFGEDGAFLASGGQTGLLPRA